MIDFKWLKIATRINRVEIGSMISKDENKNKLINLNRILTFSLKCCLVSKKLWITVSMTNRWKENQLRRWCLTENQSKEDLQDIDISKMRNIEKKVVRVRHTLLGINEKLI